MRSMDREDRIGRVHPSQLFAAHRTNLEGGSCSEWIDGNFDSNDKKHFVLILLIAPILEIL